MASRSVPQIRQYCQERVTELHERFRELILESPNTRENDTTKLENLAKQIAYQDVIEFIRGKE